MDLDLKTLLFIPTWIVVFILVNAFSEHFFPNIDRESTIPKTCLSIISVGISILFLYFI